MNREQIHELINSIFVEQAVALGGVIAVRSVDDDLVWRLVRTLDATRLRALARALYPSALSPDAAPSEEPHPAIRAFLKKLGQA